MSFAFQTSDKVLKRPPNTVINESNVVPFGDQKLWIYFDNGAWRLYDLYKSQVLKEGEIKFDDNKSSMKIMWPYSLEDKFIVYCDVAAEKLIQLDPYSGDSKEWNLTFPTLEAVPQQTRADSNTFNDSVISCKATMLNESGKYVLCEKKGDDLIVSVISANDQKYQQAVFPAGSRNFHLSKLNEKDKILLFSESIENKNFTVAVWDLSDILTGFTKYDLSVDLDGTFIEGKGWEENLALVGNFNDRIYPLLVIVNLKEKKVTDQIDIHSASVDGWMLNDLLTVDAKKKKTLYIDCGPPWYLSFFDISKKNVDCRTEVSDKYNTFKLSSNFKFVVEHRAVYTEETPQDQTEDAVFKIRVLRLIKRQKILLHMMRSHVSDGQNINLIEYYGNPYVAAQILEALGEKKDSSNKI